MLAPDVSVIIPVRNGASYLRDSLQALARSRGVTWEAVVVSDASTDESSEIAEELGCRVIRLPVRRGAAHARNVGAAASSAPILVFIDADVRVRPDTIAGLYDELQRDSSLAAVFGSYDAEPTHPGLLSQYRNLLHHHVHQGGRAEAATFWTGCGAIRREAFERIGGFDTSFHAMEDIDLGVRLRAQGYRIRLAHQIQVTHLKVWSFWSIVRTDVRDRALPWTRIIMRSGKLPDDLNLSGPQRMSALTALGLTTLGLVGLRWPRLWLAIPGLAAAFVAQNRGLYHLLFRYGGPRLLAIGVPMHLLFYLYSTAAFVYGYLRIALGKEKNPPAPGHPVRSQGSEL